MADWTHHITTCRHPHFEAIGNLYNPGSLFCIAPPEPLRSWCVVDRKKRHVEYYWKTGSESLVKLFEACERHGFVTDAPSWSRLCKHIWETEISPTPSKIKCHPYAVMLARDKRHWHQTKAVPGVYPNVTEIDIKSAYAQSFANQPTIWAVSNTRSEPDGGAMDRWRTVYPHLDKRVRLAMIGWLAGYEFTACEAGATIDAPLKRYTIRKTYDGGVFNAIHIALYQLYLMLKQMESVDPLNVPRIHTDSLWIDARIETSKLERMLDIVKANNYKIAVKGHGQAFLYNLNTGVLGGRAIGIPASVLPRFEYDRIQFPEMCQKVADLDARLGHLPYRNERFSISQLKEIMKLTFKDTLIM